MWTFLLSSPRINCDPTVDSKNGLITFFHLGFQGLRRLGLHQIIQDNKSYKGCCDWVFLFFVFFLHFKTSPHLLQSFRRTLVCCKAPEMFSELRDFTWLSISVEVRRHWLNYHFCVNLFFKMWKLECVVLFFWLSIELCELDWTLIHLLIDKRIM